jgi:hypothetical protein
LQRNLSRAAFVRDIQSSAGRRGPREMSIDCLGERDWRRPARIVSRLLRAEPRAGPLMKLSSGRPRVSPPPPRATELVVAVEVEVWRRRRRRRPDGGRQCLTAAPRRQDDVRWRAQHTRTHRSALDNCLDARGAACGRKAPVRRERAAAGPGSRQWFVVIFVRRLCSCQEAEQFPWRLEFATHDASGAA